MRERRELNVHDGMNLPGGWSLLPTASALGPRGMGGIEEELPDNLNVGRAAHQTPAGRGLVILGEGPQPSAHNPSTVPNLPDMGKSISALGDLDDEACLVGLRLGQAQLDVLVVVLGRVQDDVEIALGEPLR